MTTMARVQAMTEGVSHKPPENHKMMVLRADIEHQREILPLMIEFQAISATLTRAKYLGLINTGFTKDEAIALCK